MIPTPWGPVHFCVHELMALVYGLPFVAAAWWWMRAKCKRHEKKHDSCCKDDCW